jgi:hypothetical protein
MTVTTRPPLPVTTVTPFEPVWTVVPGEFPGDFVPF